MQEHSRANIEPADHVSFRGGNHGRIPTHRVAKDADLEVPTHQVSVTRTFFEPVDRTDLVITLVPTHALNSRHTGDYYETTLRQTCHHLVVSVYVFSTLILPMRITEQWEFSRGVWPPNRSVLRIAADISIDSDFFRQNLHLLIIKKRI